MVANNTRQNAHTRMRHDSFCWFFFHSDLSLFVCTWSMMFFFMLFSSGSRKSFIINKQPHVVDYHMQIQLDIFHTHKHLFCYPWLLLFLYPFTYMWTLLIRSQFVCWRPLPSIINAHAKAKWPLDQNEIKKIGSGDRRVHSPLAEEKENIALLGFVWWRQGGSLGCHLPCIGPLLNFNVVLQGVITCSPSFHNVFVYRKSSTQSKQHELNH